MYKKEELIELEKGFASRHFPAVVLLVIYLLVETFQSFSVGAPAFMRAAVVCLVLAAEQAFRTSDFFKSTKFIFALKYLQLIIMSGFVMHDGFRNYEYVIYVLIYLGIALELGIYYDLSDKGSIIFHALVMTAPLLVLGIVYALMDASVTYMITSIVIVATFIITMYAALVHIGNQYERFENAVLAKERMIDKAMDKNKEIIDKQEKLYYVNEQLGIKRIELESANRKINANNLEMAFQNDMLHYFTEDFDMVKIDEFFSRKLVTDMGLGCAGILKTASENDRSVFTDYKRNNPLYDVDSKYKLYGDVNEEKAAKLLEIFTSEEFIEKISDGHIYICENVKHTEYEELMNFHILSFVARLILVDGRRAGIYIICHNEPEFFLNRETFFDNILAELQVGMNNAFLYSQFENLAKCDGLTGLYNRRILNKFMEKYRHADEELKKQTVAAVMFDIDNFKSINDHYGHLFGDAAIIATASVIRSIAEEHGGVSYRYGGEEFVVLFMDRKLEEVVAIVESIHKAIREQKITLGENSIYINTSAGVSAYPELSDDPACIIDRADQAMYVSKSTGKGKITIDGSDSGV